MVGGQLVDSGVVWVFFRLDPLQSVPGQTVLVYCMAVLVLRVAYRGEFPYWCSAPLIGTGSCVDVACAIVSKGDVVIAIVSKEMLLDCVKEMLLVRLLVRNMLLD